MKGHLPISGTPTFALILFALVLLPLSHDLTAQTSQPSQPSTKANTLNDAKAKLSHGDLAGAESLLWNLLSSNPNNEEALTLLGVIRGRQHRFAEAEALFRRVLQINPQNPVAHRDLGTALVEQEKFDEALEEFTKAEVLDPHDVPLKIQLAQIYASKGQFAQALSTLDKIPAAHLPPEAIPIKAASLLAAGRANEAGQLIEQAKVSSSTELDLAEVFLNAKLPDQALRCLALVAEPSKHHSSRYYVLKGRALQVKGNNPEALRAYREGLAIDPKSNELLAGAAEIEAAEKNHAQAMASLRQAHAENPESLPILRQLVIEAVRSGDQKTALDAANTLSEKSASPEDLYLAGAALLELNASGASGLLEKYVAQRDNDPKGWLGLGIAYVQQKRYPEAYTALQHSLRLDPNSAEANYQLGLAAKAESNSAQAVAFFQRALELQPNHFNALLNLGNLYLQSGELQKARDTLQQAEALNPKNLETEYDLGLVLSKLGQPELARQHMEEFRKLKDAQPPAQQDHQ